MDTQNSISSLKLWLLAHKLWITLGAVIIILALSSWIIVRDAQENARLTEQQRLAEQALIESRANEMAPSPNPQITPQTTYKAIPKASNSSARKASSAPAAAPNVPSGSVVFTHAIIDPSTLSFITPLGELNGGYEEAQTIAGVMLNFKQEAVTSNKEIEVKAPTDMTLESYSWHNVPYAPGSNWALIFRLSNDLTIKFDHISRASDTIKTVTEASSKDSSAEISPKQRLTVKAGEVIGYTFGTVPAHNWNIYLFDSRHKNSFINQKRYEGSGTGKKLINAKCVFDFYANDLKNSYLSLMGYNKAGQSSTCGLVSRDVTGTASGMWHLSTDGFKEERDELYTAPLSIIKNSAGEITIDQIGDQRIDIRSGNPTLKDPAEVRDAHCYQADNNKGYIFVKIVSESQMNVAAASTGSCPSELPSSTKAYYR